jgi:hypothetical protein
MANTFWSEASIDPARRFRFQIQIGDLPAFYVKTASMPKATISSIEHSYLDHTFKFPGRVTWDPISVTFVSPSDGTVTKALSNVLRAAGWTPPESEISATRSLSKQGFKTAFGSKDVTITLMDAAGAPKETWVLKNSFLTSIDFGGSLDYTSDELVEISLEIAYDWAQMG